MPGLVPPSHDERTLLLGFLAQQRYVAKLAAYGLTDEQATSAPSVSTLSVAGLIKHLARTERHWVQVITQEPITGGQSDYLETFTPQPGETLAGLIAEYDATAAETERVIGEIADLDQPVPVPKGRPWFPADIEAWSVRWVLLHLIEETARHAGHADLVRESVDGATAYPLMAAAEGWPETDWMKPWKPTVTS